MSNQAQENIPTTTVAGNAINMEILQKQLEQVKTAMAEQTASEVNTILQMAIKESEKEKVEEIPTPHSTFLLGRLASACFMALRDELVSAYMRNESVQKDRMILLDRVEKNAFRSDVERTSTERTLAYYESLQERFDEVRELISQFTSLHRTAQEWQRQDDDSRQVDVPLDERTYVTLPSLRWATNAEKQEKNWEEANDLARLKHQAAFWLQYNSNA